MADRSRLYRTKALILRRRDYGDADRILTLFSPDKGRMVVIAKGVRKTSSRKAGHLELFTHSTLLLAQARTWDIITEAQTVEAFPALRTDLDAISRAGYLCELAEAFSESDDDHKSLWDLTLGMLRELDVACAEENDLDRNVLLTWFVLHLLSLSGFQPNFFTCLACGEEIKPETNFLSITDGGLFCPRCAQSQPGLEAVEPDVLKVLRYLQIQPWPVARVLRVRPQPMRRMENILHRTLMATLERQLRSVDFLRRMQNDPRFFPTQTSGITPDAHS